MCLTTFRPDRVDAQKVNVRSDRVSGQSQQHNDNWGETLRYTCCFSHSAYWFGCVNPKKTTLRGDQSRLWSAEQEKKNEKRKSDSFSFIVH